MRSDKSVVRTVVVWESQSVKKSRQPTFASPSNFENTYPFNTLMGMWPITHALRIANLHIQRRWHKRLFHRRSSSSRPRTRPNPRSRRPSLHPVPVPLHSTPTRTSAAARCIPPRMRGGGSWCLGSVTVGRHWTCGCWGGGFRRGFGIGEGGGTAWLAHC